MPEIIKKYRSFEAFQAGAPSLATQVAGSLQFRDDQIQIIRRMLLKPEAIERKCRELVDENPRVKYLEKQIAPLVKKQDTLTRAPAEAEKLKKQLSRMKRACHMLRSELKRQATLTLVHTDRAIVVVVGKKPVLTVPYKYL